MAPASESAASEWRRGWRSLAAATIGMAVGYSLFLMTANLFIIPMEREWHVPRSALVLGPIVGMMSALLSPAAGLVIDRFGARPLALGGLGALGAIYAMMALLPSSLALLYAMTLLLALVTPFASHVIFCRGVAAWFERSTGAAMGITMSGTAVGSTLALPVLAWIIEQHGWRAGYAALSAIVLLIGLPVLFAWFRDRPTLAVGDIAPAKERPWPVLRRVSREGRFWIMNFAFGLAGLFIGGFMSQMQPILVDKGFSPVSAAALASIYAAAVGCGRLAAGWALDRWRPDRVAMACLLAAAGGAALLSAMTSSQPSPLLAAFALALIGMGQGAEADFLAFFTVRLFGMPAFAAIFGVFALTVGVGIALGGLLFAWLFDRTGGYGAATLFAAVVMALAGCLIGTLRVFAPSADSGRAVAA